MGSKRGEALVLNLGPSLFRRPDQSVVRYQHYDSNHRSNHCNNDRNCFCGSLRLCTFLEVCRGINGFQLKFFNLRQILGTVDFGLFMKTLNLPTLNSKIVHIRLNKICGTGFSAIGEHLNKFLALFKFSANV